MSESMEYEHYANMDSEIKAQEASVDNLTEIAIEQIKTATMKDTTIKVYRRLVHKLIEEIKTLEGDNLRFYKSIPFFIYYNPDGFLKWLFDKPWGVALSQRSVKNYLSLVCSWIRNYINDDVNGKSAYELYFKKMCEIRDKLDKKQEKQEPKEKEIILKEYTLNHLFKFMLFWDKKCQGKANLDCYSGFMYAMGHIHIDQVLRNELTTVLLSKDYLIGDEHKKTNFIWLKGRNQKLLVIRDNKVRNADRGDPAKEVWLSGKVNTAINKYIQILRRNDFHIDTPTPFCWSITDDCPKEMSSSLYSQNFRKLFKHRDLPISTTDMRKIYAMDVRKEFKGNLIKEKEACAKLDHSKDTHDKHYILEFD